MCHNQPSDDAHVTLCGPPKFVELFTLVKRELFRLSLFPMKSDRRQLDPKLGQQTGNNAVYPAMCLVLSQTQIERKLGFFSA